MASILVQNYGPRFGSPKLKWGEILDRKMGQKLAQKWTKIRSKNGPKNGPKSGPKMDQNQALFWTKNEVRQNPTLSAKISKIEQKEPKMAQNGPKWAKNGQKSVQKNCCPQGTPWARTFQNRPKKSQNRPKKPQNGPIWAKKGLIWANLGQKWAIFDTKKTEKSSTLSKLQILRLKKWPKMGPKWAPKSVQKMVQNWPQKWPKNGSNFSPFLAPKSAPKMAQNLQQKAPTRSPRSPPRSQFLSFCSPKMTHLSPRMASAMVCPRSEILRFACPKWIPDAHRWALQWWAHLWRKHSFLHWRQCEMTWNQWERQGLSCSMMSSHMNDVNSNYGSCGA